MSKGLTKKQRLEVALIKAQAEKDVLCAEFVIECENLDEEIEVIKDELYKIETYGDMA